MQSSCDVAWDRAACDADLIVIGGGPGGSTVSTLVARNGHRVVLLEREQFPRHQLGESLLPATIHGICSLLGVREQVDRAGFPRKRGGTFLWGTNPKPWTFVFGLNPTSPMAYAYQVERARFDQILLENARRQGVDVREQHAVHSCIIEGERVVGVRYTDASGVKRELRAPFVVDAGGHRSGFHKLVGDRKFSTFFQNVALYTYFENGKRLPAPDSGNILCCAFSEGWFWYIPLSDTLTSVGVVLAKERAEALLQQGEDAAFRAAMAECPLISEYLAGAERVTTGMYGAYRVRKDYSYCNTSFWRPGLVLIGDTACFIDPVFSSGVHLATYSGLLAARSINTLLGERRPRAEPPQRADEGSGRKRLTERTVFAEFERRYRREFGNFYQFLLSFYDYHQDEASYFWQARRVLNSPEEASAAFVRLVAGRSESNEPIFAGRPSLPDTVAGVEGIFRDISASDDVQRAYSATEGFDRATFMAGFTQEISQLQLLARMGSQRPEEAPLFEGGLVPSRDGLSWSSG